MTERESHRNAAAVLARSYHNMWLTAPKGQRQFRGLLRRYVYQTIWNAQNVFPRQVKGVK